MQFSVRDWMMDLVVFVKPDITVSEALAIMRRRYIHSVIVDKSGTKSDYGILTSTDICDKIVAQGLNPSKVKVGEIMNSPVITIKRDATLKECAITMKERRIHHMPVIDDEQKIVGMISATDFLVAAEAMGREPGERIV